MVWVPSTKVHARFVLSKMFVKNFFTLIKLWKVEKVTEVRVITTYVVQVPGDDGLPSLVSPLRLLKSYYHSSGPGCVQVTV
jgi:hypothetical protein